MDLNQLKPDLCLITETWLNDSILSDSLNIKGYDLFRSDRNFNATSKTRAGGVCIYALKSLQTECILFEDSSHQSFSETLWLNCVLNERNFFVGCIYYPPDSNCDIQLAEYILDKREIVLRKNPACTFLVAGDLNNFNSDLLTDFSDLVQINKNPTRFEKILDKVLCSKPELYKPTSVINCYLSTDHLAVYCEPLQEKTERYHASFRKASFANREVFGITLDRVDMSLIDYSCPDLAFTQLNNLLLELLDVTCPIKTVRLSARDPNYMTPLLKSLLKKKYRMKKKDRISTEIENAIKMEIKKNLTKSKRGTKSWWQEVNYLTGRKNLTSTANHEPDELNQYFADICTSTEYIEPHVCNVSGYDSPEVSLQQIYSQLKRLKQTATGPDQIPYWVWKENAHSLAEPVLKILNLSILQTKVPSLLQTAKIVPIAKCKAPMGPEDYRPISITPVISRFFERIIMKNFISAQYNSWLPKNQHGFRNSASTTTAMICLQQEIASFQKSKADYIQILSIDLSKAFDRAQHSIIIDKLQSVRPEINPFIINWIANFLQDRKIFTESNSQRSNLLCINQGVPQGTVLGPPLFNTVSYDLDLESTNSARIIKFADDANSVIAGFGSVENTMKVLEEIKTWCSTNNFILNEGKTKLMTVKPNDISLVPQAFDGIEQVEELKILGVLFDSRLTFSSHIKSLCKKVTSSIYLLYRLKTFGMNISALDILYKILVQSKITYALPVWACANSTELADVDKVQRRALKLGVTSTFTPIFELIENHDNKLLQSSSKQDHILHSKLPKRETYAENRLKEKAVAAHEKLEKHFKLFPARALRNKNFL